MRQQALYPQPQVQDQRMKRLSRKERKRAERDAHQNAYADVMSGQTPYTNYPPPGAYPSSSAGTPRFPMPTPDYGFPPPRGANNVPGPSSRSDNRDGASGCQSQPSEQDFKRWFDMCKKAKGQAEMLHEALVYATPGDLKGDLITEFHETCTKNQTKILDQVAKATANAERSRRNARSAGPTQEERLVEELLSVNEQIMDALKMYDELEQVGAESEAVERLRAERRNDILAAISEYTPTQEEAMLLDQIFARADPQRTGFVRTLDAERTLWASNLSSAVLEQIWDIMNIDDGDALSRQQVGVALRLVGHAQAGTPVSELLILRSGPAPYIEAISPPHSTNRTIEIPGFPQVTPDDRKKFVRIFNSGHPVNGFINAASARDLFSKSKLSRETLAKIWDFADTANNGHFDIPRFSIAMYLIQACMSRYFVTVPRILPLAIYETFGAPPPAPSPPTPALSHQQSFSSRSAGPSRSSSISRSALEASLIDLADALPAAAMTPTSPISPSGAYPGFGSPSPRPSAASADPFATPPTRTPTSRSPPSSPFVTPSYAGALLRAASDDERMRVDGYFDSLDADRMGWIGADVAVPFFTKSRLPDSVMADIWDMADADRNGRLSRDEFALAMHLVMKALRGEPLATPTVPVAPSTPASVPPISTPAASATESDRDRSLPLPPLPPRPMSMASTVFQQPVAAPTAPEHEQEEAQSVHVIPEEEERSDTPPPPYSLVAAEGEEVASAA